MGEKFLLIRKDQSRLVDIHGIDMVFVCVSENGQHQKEPVFLSTAFPWQLRVCAILETQGDEYSP